MSTEQGAEYTHSGDNKLKASYRCYIMRLCRIDVACSIADSRVLRTISEDVEGWWLGSASEELFTGLLTSPTSPTKRIG